MCDFRAYRIGGIFIFFTLLPIFVAMGPLQFLCIYNRISVLSNEELALQVSALSNNSLHLLTPIILLR
jgi:hypothetical protein